MRIVIHGGHYSGHRSTFYVELSHFSDSSEWWILGVLGSSPRRSFLIPKSRVTVFLIRQCQKRETGSIRSDGGSQGGSVVLGWILGFLGFSCSSKFTCYSLLHKWHLLSKLRRTKCRCRAYHVDCITRIRVASC